MTRAAEFDEFVAARASALLRTAELLRPGDGEDLLQAALLKTWMRWSQLKDTSHPSAEAYVRTTMSRLAIKWGRRRWRGEVPTTQLPVDTASEDRSSVEDRELLLSAMGDLPDRWRLVLVLRFAEDLSESQVADALGMSVGTVKSSTSRALARLREVPELRDLLTSTEMNP